MRRRRRKESELSAVSRTETEAAQGGLTNTAALPGVILDGGEQLYSP